MKYLRNLWSNIKYLMLYSLRERDRELMYDCLKRVEDIYNYEIKDGNVNNTLKILNAEQTLDLLLSRPKVFAGLEMVKLILCKEKTLFFKIMIQN